MSSNRIFPQRTVIVSSLEVAKREFRLDPTRFNERADSIVRHFRLKGFETTPLGDLPGVSGVFVPPRFKRPYVSGLEHGTPFLGSSSMLALRLPTDAVLSSSFKKLKSLTLEGGEILLSCSGTIGVSVLCGQSYKGFAVSQHAARIFASEGIRGFLHAYLSSDIGRELVLQQNYGKVIKELSEEQICRVSVPSIDSNKANGINAMMIQAVALYDVARSSLDVAERELSRALSLDTGKVFAEDWLGSNQNSFLRSSDRLVGHRLDPHFHSPKANAQRQRLYDKKHKLLGSIASLWNPTRFARPKVEKGHGVEFYSSADMMRARRIPSITIAKKAKRHLTQCRIERDTILICRSGAYGGIMGRATYATAAMDGWAVTDHMVRCQITDSDFLPGYVCALLASKSIGYPIITALRHGKDVPELDPEELGSIPVPILAEAEQRAIAKHINAASAAADKANALESDAIRKLLKYLSFDENN